MMAEMHTTRRESTKWLFVAAGLSAVVASGAMNVSFDDKNTLRAIRVGAAEFATGGGDLWTAEFAQDGNLTNRVKVSAHEAVFFGRSGSGAGEEILVWRDVPLGVERGVLDAKVAIEKRADGSQAWRLSFDNRSRGWFLQDILDRPDKCGILRELCAFRQNNLDALAYGNLLDELRFAGPVGTSTYEWLGRRPHFRLFDKTFKLPPSKFAAMTDVIGNWWRTADGEVVLLAANLADSRQDIECHVFGTDETMRLSLAPHELVRVSHGTGTRIQSKEGN